eukprot:350422-Chlamydomonas_euryale.AAC.4
MPFGEHGPVPADAACRNVHLRQPSNILSHPLPRMAGSYGSGPSESGLAEDDDLQQAVQGVGGQKLAPAQAIKLLMQIKGSCAPLRHTELSFVAKYHAVGVHEWDAELGDQTSPAWSWSLRQRRRVQDACSLIPTGRWCKRTGCLVNGLRRWHGARVRP